MSITSWLAAAAFGSAAVGVLGALLHDRTRHVGLGGAVLLLGLAAFFASFWLLVAASHGWRP